MAGHSARTAGTPLQRQLAGTSPARPTALDGFRLARRTFLAGERIDMQTLARSLGVDRATLYRWVGSRERLLTEILWSLHRAHRHHAAPGRDPGGRRDFTRGGRHYRHRARRDDRYRHAAVPRT